MTKSGKKRTGAQSRDAEIAPAAKLYHGDPEIASGYPLVCHRQNPFPGPDWAHSEVPIFPPPTVSQRWLASHGFHPAWWLPERLAEKWKTQFYPLKATIESVSEWRRLIEAIADMRAQGHSALDQIELRSMLLASMENDFGLLVTFNPKLRAAAAGPKTHMQQRDQFVYEEVMRGERYSSISLRLPGVCAAQGWPDEGDNTAIRCHQIAANYASANGLPAPDPRQIF
jgi:hypothetical protein